ncbi:hypothetical protein Rhopal_006283-T1 [Rhodotorula paludigena]|uniref:NADPH-dependent FMN reductase-like domain-containing protein n=1 Tax=Rhodotorula paludigena TaxID=86838 RepID=A0AAV5GUQ5_9BASI|nr:hypothetical protein Rhopal_006283-T1 [Rhodotorula paludigena]
MSSTSTSADRLTDNASALAALSADDVERRYRPFRATKNAVGEADWVESLELDTVKQLVERSQERDLRVLVLYGSLRERSFSRLTAFEASRILSLLGADVRVFDPAGLPMKDGVSETHAKVVELRALSEWSDAQMWVSPEQHGTITAVMKNQIDWIPLSVGSLGRWMRMWTIPNQSSIPKAWTQFTSSDRLLPSSNRDRLVDVCEELIKATVLLRPHVDLLGDRFSEREERREHGRLRTQAEVEAAKKRSEEEKVAVAEAAKRGSEVA